MITFIIVVVFVVVVVWVLGTMLGGAAMMGWMAWMFGKWFKNEVDLTKQNNIEKAIRAEPTEPISRINATLPLRIQGQLLLETVVETGRSSISDTIPNPDDEAISKAINSFGDNDGFFTLSKDEYAYIQVARQMPPSYDVDYRKGEFSYFLHFREGEKTTNLATVINSREEALSVVTNYLHGRDFKNGHDWKPWNI